nr:MAG TPA: hypothetical protein [Caudoviricetes sp.]
MFKSFIVYVIVDKYTLKPVVLQLINLFPYFNF